MISVQPSHNVGEKYDMGEEQSRKFGSWSYQQNVLYVVFLDVNKAFMVSKKKRKHLKIFDRMAEFLTTRDSLQCRSHHQKVLEKFLDIKNILIYLKRIIKAEDYKRQYNLHSGKKQKRQNKKIKEEQLSDAPQIRSTSMEIDEEPLIKVESSSGVSDSVEIKDVKSQEDNQDKQELQMQMNQINQSLRQQYGIMNLQFQYMQYCYEGGMSPAMPFGMYNIFQQSLF